MSYCFCGSNIDCWVAWLTNPATVGWVQGIGALAAAVVAVVVASHAAQRESKAKRDAIQRNTESIIQVQRYCTSVIEEVIKEAKKGGPIGLGKLIATLRQIQFTHRQVEFLMTQPTAHKEVVLALSGYMLPSEQVCIVIEDILEQAKASRGTLSPLGLRPAIPDQTLAVLEDQVAVMSAIIEAMTIFSVELRTSQKAKFPGIQISSKDEGPEEKKLGED
ncbi:MAG: hypothetical protein ACJAZ5_000170 [Alloalcanivorax venustensis]|jgi:hypothetical protein|nr:hypothetical protein SAMN06272769_10721 [Alcanivorax sp. DSM 26295]|tara:strand:+ start:1059 stop:1715 length:657 start_codon:yes stop_codon:yes gene_type:complete